MAYGTLDEIRAYCRKMVRLLGRPSGGFIPGWYADPVSAGHRAEAVDAMKEAFLQLSSGEAEVPLRTHIEAPSHRGNVLVMPCYVPARGRMSVKCVTLFDENPKRGLPGIQGLVTLFDATD